MAYLGDPRENRIGPNGELWETDNRVEERHYWNGAFVDLCDMKFDEYNKTIFVTNCGGGEGGGGDKPGKKKVSVTLFERRDTLEKNRYRMCYWFESSDAVDIDVYPSAVVATSGSEKVELNFTIAATRSKSEEQYIDYNEGEMKPRPEQTIVDKPDTPKQEIIPIPPIVYPYIRPSSMTNTDYKSFSDDQDLLNFVMAYTPVNMESEKESEEFTLSHIESTTDIPADISDEAWEAELEENSTVFILLVDKEIKRMTLGQQEAIGWKKSTIVDQQTGKTFYKYTLSREPGGENMYWEKGHDPQLHIYKVKVYF